MARRHAFRYFRAPRNDICAFPIPGNEKTGPGMQTLVTDFDWKHNYVTITKISHRTEGRQSAGLISDFSAWQLYVHVTVRTGQQQTLLCLNSIARIYLELNKPRHMTFIFLSHICVQHQTKCTYGTSWQRGLLTRKKRAHTPYYTPFNCRRLSQNKSINKKQKFNITYKTTGVIRNSTASKIRQGAAQPIGTYSE